MDVSNETSEQTVTLVSMLPAVWHLQIQVLARLQRLAENGTTHCVLSGAQRSPAI